MGYRTNLSSIKRTPKKLYGHMESVISPIVEIDPTTGEPIPEKEVDKKLVINHHFKKKRNVLDTLMPYYEKGVSNLTEKEIEKAYKLIKGINPCNKIL